MATIVDVPDRSLQQRRDALAVGNAIRSKRAVLKRDLKAGRVQLASLLLDPPEWLESAKVDDLLRSVAAIGPVKTTRILHANGISPSKTVGGLSTRQRASLTAALSARPSKVLSAPRTPLGTSPGAQHMQALDHANVVRFAQSEIKQGISAGTMTVVEVLSGMPEGVRSMPLFDLIAAQHRWGRSRTRRLLVHLGLPEWKTVGSLTQRQVGLVTEALEVAR
jgi:ribosomal protein S13